MTQRNSGPYIQMGCGCLLLIALLLGTVIALLGKHEADHFWDNGVRVEGRITSIDSEISRSRARGRIVGETVRFWYPVGEQTFHHYQRFSYDTSFYPGQPVPVIYLPNTPWTAEILVDKSIDPFIVLVTGIGILVLLGLSIRIYRRSASKKQKPSEKPIA